MVGPTSIAERPNAPGRAAIALTFFVFDVLAVEGLSTAMQLYAERRAILEQLELENQRARLVATFEDGEALFDAVCARGLEGVVAQRDHDAYRPRRASVGEHEEPRDGSLRERTRRRRSACQGVSETPGALGRSRFRQGEAGHELLHPSEKTDRDRR